MIVKTDPTPIYNHATDAFYLAAEDTLEHVRAGAPRVTGDYQASLKLWRRKRASGPTARIGSRLIYAGVIERGGGPRLGWAHKGPHVQRANAPRPLATRGVAFASFYAGRLASTPMRTASIIAFDFGGERGLPNLLLAA